MSLPLTPETLAAAYDLLATTPPFNDWGLPPSEDIKFVVSRDRDCFARYRWLGTRHQIAVSSRSVAYANTLLEKMGHEIIHLHLEELGMDSRGNANTHSGAFCVLAAEVCEFHGWDPKAFY